MEWLRAGTDPARVRLVSRSQASALALRGRVEAELGAAHAAVRVDTHEGLARWVLDQFGAMPAEPLILGAAGEWLAMSKALVQVPRLPLFRLKGMEEDPGAIDDALAILRAFKQALVGPGLLAQRLREAPPQFQELAVVAAAYQSVLDRASAWDQGDLASKALELLWGDRARLQGWADLLLVDEAEDLSPSQWFVLRELSQRLTPPHRLVLAGDPRESIPAFWGPSSRAFVEGFPGELRPEEWRLPDRTPGWLAAFPAAGAADARDNRPAPGSLEIWQAPDETEEAFAVAREVMRAHLAGLVAFSEVGIVVRSAGPQLAVLEDALRVIGVPYRLEQRGASGPAAVEVLQAWLGLLAQPDNPGRLRQALLRGPKAMRPGAFRLLESRAGRVDREPAWLFWRLSAGDPLPRGSDRGAEYELELLAAARRWRGLDPGLPGAAVRPVLWERFRDLCSRVELASGLAEAALREPEVATALAAFERELKALARLEAALGPGPPTLQRWLRLCELAAVRSATAAPSSPDGAEQVTLTTVSRAKGRHWRWLFVCGCVPGSFPAAPRVHGLLEPAETDDLLARIPELEDVLPTVADLREQEARTFLVAVTRGRERVICTWARRQGQAVGESSPFLAALRPQLPQPSRDPAAQVTLDDVDALLAIRTPDLASLPASAAALSESLQAWDPSSGAPVGRDQPWRLSATSLRDWLACPRKFLLSALRLHEAPSLSLTVGSQLHALLKFLYQERERWQSGGEDVLDVGRAWLVATAGPRIREELPNPLQRRLAQDWLLHLLGRWEERVVRPGAARVGEPIAAEVGFEYQIAGRSLQGRVDALWRQPQGSVELVDYKTSADKPGPKEMQRKLFGDAEQGPSDWQLAIYHIAARRGCLREQLGEDQPAVLANWYLALSERKAAPFPRAALAVGESAEPAKGQLSLEQLARLEAAVGLQVEQIARGRFPARPRNDAQTCRDSSRTPCPMRSCCDGDGSVGRELELEPPRP